MMRARAHTPGFTLVEVVIAIFVAMIMFTIGYAAINQALRHRDGINESQARTAEIQRGMRIVAQDFAQIIARGARDTSGNGQLMPAVLADGRDNTLLTFTRAGWTNPVGLQRPAEQRVRYRFIDGSLVREHWLAVDPALNTEPLQRVLITRVKAVEVRFLDPVSRDWRTEWPASAPAAQLNPAQSQLTLPTRPLAIEFTVVLEDWGRVLRLFEIPA
jgi:general secretion pathway protein J